MPDVFTEGRLDRQENTTLLAGLQIGRHGVCRPGFLVQLSEENSFLVVCACLAGVFLMLGTMCLQYGLAYAGMAVCLPYQIAVSISVGEHKACFKHLTITA